MSAIILTSQGLPIIVDRADYDLLGDYTWTVSKTGNKYYAYNTELGYMHRLILGLSKGDGLVGDHINGCTIDNRRKNLRAATHAQNTFNAAVKRNNVSGLRGVTYVKSTGKFQSRIRYGGKRVTLGYFDTAEEAAQAYAEKAAIRQSEMENNVSY